MYMNLTLIYYSKATTHYRVVVSCVQTSIELVAHASARPYGRPRGRVRGRVHACTSHYLLTRLIVCLYYYDYCYIMIIIIIRR